MPKSPLGALCTPQPATCTDAKTDANQAAVKLLPAQFASLPGWRDDNLAEAWSPFLLSCKVLRAKPDWTSVCDAARSLESSAAPTSDAIRAFFEQHFVPYQVGSTTGNDNGLITGYFEPKLRGSRKRGRPFLTPLYAVPDDLITVDLADVVPELKGLTLRGRLEGHRLVAYPSRAAIEAGSAPTGKEIVWVDDPLAAFFLEVQGSGRVQIYDQGQPTEIIRLAYADQNGRPYRSIGRWLVDQGELRLDRVSMQSIRDWALAHPERLQSLLDANPSYVFFKEMPVADPGLGPLGALGVPLTPLRSVAVDIRSIPLGAPVFLATVNPTSGETLRRLTMAQDTGGAIRSTATQPARADLFWGFGEAAAEAAGHMKEQGQMWVLLPRDMQP